MTQIIFRVLRGILPAVFVLNICCGTGYCAPVFSDVQGKVLYRASADREWIQARPGMRVAEGGRIKTGWFSWAEIRYDERTLAGLGFDTDFVIYTANADEYFSRLFSGSVRAVVKSGQKFSIKTPVTVAAVTVSGTRFITVVTALGQTKVRVFSGVVGVSDAKKRDKRVKPEETLSVDKEGSGPPERLPAASLGGGWAMAAPYGFRSRGKKSWEMKTGAQTGVAFQGLAVTLEHSETLSSEFLTLKLSKGQAWPMECPGGTAPAEIRKSYLEGRLFFSYACPAQDLGQGEWQNRYFDLPIEDKDGGVSSALRLHYKHQVRAKLPAAAKLRKLYPKGPGAGGYEARFQSDVMPEVAAVANKTKVDGPGVKAATEAVLSVYREMWAGSKNTDSYTGKVVPMIE